MITIYILKCRDNKYYVGKTEKTAMKRYEEHTAGNGCAWTRKYKPIELVEYFFGDKFDEDKKTKLYMDKYGINNVRGGAYSQIKLDEASIASLNREMNGVNDKCNKCGKLGHFMRDCKYKKSNKCARCNKCGKLGHFMRDSKYKKSNKCARCNREGHTENQCYATTYV